MKNKNNQYINQFLDYINIEKRYSINTLRAYENDLNQFASFLKSSDSIINIKKPTINYYLEFLIEKGINSKSLARKVACLKSFYNFHLRRKNTSNNVLKFIKTPKIAKKLPEFLNINQINKLLNPDLYLKNYKGTRDLLIIDLLYSTGIRVSELVNIHIKNIDFQDRLLKVLGKGKKERIVVFGEQTGVVLTDYTLKLKKTFSGKKNKYLFPYQGHPYVEDKHISTKSVFNIVKKKIYKVTNNANFGPHSLRHSFASHLIDSGADLMSIKDLLGHSSLSSTQIYTHVKLNKLIETYNQSHPHSK